MLIANGIENDSVCLAANTLRFHQYCCGHFIKIFNSIQCGKFFLNFKVHANVDTVSKILIFMKKIFLVRMSHDQALFFFDHFGPVCNVDTVCKDVHGNVHTVCKDVT